jgi:hypothetical protein
VGSGGKGEVVLSDPGDESRERLDPLTVHIAQRYAKLARSRGENPGPTQCYQKAEEYVEMLRAANDFQLR